MDKSIGSNLPRIKVQNQFAIKEVIYKEGPISRLEIAEKLGLTLPTITTNISTMIKEGLIKEVDAPSEPGTLGRKTMLVDINESYALFMGLEVRGTARSVVISNSRGKVIASLSDERAYTDYDEALESAVELSKRILTENNLTFDDILAIGISIPGIVDKKEKILLIHPGYKWENKAIAKDYRERTGYTGEIYTENNTISRAYQMSMFSSKGLGDADSMAYLFISTGIGCPLLSNVHSHFGDVTGDGEVGHMVMDPRGPKCVCGNNGCLEAYSSEKAMIDKAIKGANKSEKLNKVLKENGTITLSDILCANDELSNAIISEAIEYLGLAIANIDNFVRPECMVIEGKLFDKEENRERLLSVIHKNLYRVTFSDYRFCFIKSDDYSGAKGAVAIAIKGNLEKYSE